MLKKGETLISKISPSPLEIDIDRVEERRSLSIQWGFREGQSFPTSQGVKEGRSPSYKTFPLSFEGEGDKGDEVERE